MGNLAVLGTGPPLAQPIGAVAKCRSEVTSNVKNDPPPDQSSYHPTVSLLQFFAFFS
jgi:hypothetical protein